MIQKREWYANLRTRDGFLDFLSDITCEETRKFICRYELVVENDEDHKDYMKFMEYNFNNMDIALEKVRQKKVANPDFKGFVRNDREGYLSSWTDVLKKIGWTKLEIADFNFLTRKEEDLAEFERKFFNLVEKHVVILDRFRNYLLEKYKMTEVEFLELAEKDLKGALESLFQQNISPVDIKLLNRRQKEWGLTLSDFYRLHMTNRVIRLWNWLSTTYTLEKLREVKGGVKVV